MFQKSTEPTTKPTLTVHGHATVHFTSDTAKSLHEFMAELQAFIVSWEDKIKIDNYNQVYNDNRKFDEVFTLEYSGDK